MPKCRNCNKTISKQDFDICPYCGTPHPIESGYKTQDVTQFIDPVTGEYELYTSKSRLVAVLLEAFLGLFGAGFFYLGRKKWALISLIVTLVLVGGVGSLIYFLAWPSFLAYLIFIIVSYLPHWGYAFYLGLSHSAKDGQGEFLR